MYIFVFLLSFWVFPLTGFAMESPVQKTLERIPKEDRENLEDFFKSLFKGGEFAYVLLGEKPMACIDYSVEGWVKTLPIFEGFASMSFPYVGSKVWNKYKDLFSSKRFLILEHVSEDYSFLGFVFLNIDKLKEIYSDDQILMQRIFDDIENLLKIVKEPRKKDPKKDLNSRFDWALGKLLGYGEKNAETFENRSQLTNYLLSAPLNLSDLNHKDTKNTLFRKNFLKVTDSSTALDYSKDKLNQAVQTLNELKSTFKIVPSTLKDTSLSPFDLPRFLSVEGNEETQKIRASYDRVRQQIVEIFYADNFLEIVLTLLSS